MCAEDEMERLERLLRAAVWPCEGFLRSWVRVSGVMRRSVLCHKYTFVFVFCICAPAHVSLAVRASFVTVQIKCGFSMG